MKRIDRVLASFRGRRFGLVVGLFTLIFCAAPTPGDVGGCGQKPAELDPEIFFLSKETIDCQRCSECGISSKACEGACKGTDTVGYPKVFPADCVPLVHDGEVCLRVLLDASCGDYATYMDDRAPEAPTECNFCPEPRP